MRAKTLNEATPFKPKSEEEINDLIKVGKPIHADMLVHLINKSEIGENIKVNFTGAWDRFGPIRAAKAIDVNLGAGFEKALFVTNNTGTFIYTPEFQLDNLPTKESLLMFYAGTRSMYIDEILFE